MDVIQIDAGRAPMLWDNMNSTLSVNTQFKLWSNQEVSVSGVITSGLLVTWCPKQTNDNDQQDCLSGV